MASNRVIVRAVGEWFPGQVRVRWDPTGGRAVVPAVERLIDAAWAAAAARPGVQLFDGPMCRMEAWDAAADGTLHLALSPTSYRPFLGTNMTHPELADDPRYGPRVMANPVGLSSALVTSDGWLLLGRRNARVAYYPSRVHPFAGCLEPGDPIDVFAEARRELREEVGFADADVAEIRLAGIAEDVSLRQPELIFRVRTPRTRAAVEAGLLDDEHHAVCATPLREREMADLLRDPALTPVAVGAVLLTGRAAFGEAWFGLHAPLR
jgi:8-oxo-dGTP pyrophosphatase MutT (NUDIX family)